MNLEEFEVDGKKILLDNELEDGETDEINPEDIDEEKTHEIKIFNDEELFGTTLTDIFGEDKNE